ncbi:hypothetical protein [Ktedonobacter robiniae]|uniref:Uncharacterized protein n=1 Tax=Ktedonobacter robiniae TaxID=2778365 RepID=A0ABQ3V6E9_9CHLR|nr:hypothetical protein [Ktedonobacter robiniae]GHO60794.1 hypothetical protein KSB_92690 [Ktedonobacter robiniae]
MDDTHPLTTLIHTLGDTNDHGQNTLHMQLPDGRSIDLTPEQALDFVTWLAPHMPDLPETLATWLAQQSPPSPDPDLPPLEPYCVVECSPLDGCFHIVDFGLDLP